MPALKSSTLHKLLASVREHGRRTAQPLESRCVMDLSYDPEQEKMTLEFVKRGTYVYDEVPLDVYVDFAQATSQGTYFNLYIRDKFSFERVA